MTGQTVLVLGGGVGGLTAANELRRRLAPHHRVVVVDKRAEHLFTPSLLWLMVGARRPEQLTRDLRKMVRPGVEVLRAEAHELDVAHRRVAVDGLQLGYDALVVGLGADITPEAVPGHADVVHSFYDLEGAVRLQGELGRFLGGRVVVAVTALPYKCPAAPYEAALLIEHMLRQRGVRGRSEVVVVTPEPQPMPVAGPAMGQAVTALLEARGIRTHFNRPLQAIDSERRELVFAEGDREPFDLLAAVPPHTSPAVVKESPLANESGWIPVDKATLRTAFDGVYALGDVAAIKLSNGKMLPKAGVFAHAQALAVAHAVTAQIQGGEAEAFDGGGYCWVELGGGEAAFATGDFYAEPDPEVQLRKPGALWHLGKVLFERYWMGEGFERAAAQAGLAIGRKLAGVHAAL